MFLLITVMAVMNGFRKELFSKILGLNGHVIVQKVGGDDFDDYAAAAERLADASPGVKHVVPLIEGQAMASTPHLALAGLVRGIEEDGIKSLSLIANNVRFGTPRRLRHIGRHRHRHAPCQFPARQCRRSRHAGVAARAR